MKTCEELKKLWENKENCENFTDGRRSLRAIVNCANKQTNTKIKQKALQGLRKLGDKEILLR